MMGSVLSLLDPLEPMTAFAGERSRALNMTTNLFGAGTGKQPDYLHHHRHPLRAWSSASSSGASSRRGEQQLQSGLKGPLVDASRAAGQQQQQQARMEQARRSDAAAAALAVAAAVAAKAGSRRAAAAAAAHAQDESVFVVGNNNSTKLQAAAGGKQQKVQHQRMAATAGDPDDAEEAAAPEQDKQQQVAAAAARLLSRQQQRHSHRDQQRNKGHESAAATTMSNNKTAKTIITTTTQVACTGQQRGHLQLQQHHQLNNRAASAAAAADKAHHNQNNQPQLQTNSHQPPKLSQNSITNPNSTQGGQSPAAKLAKPLSQLEPDFIDEKPQAAMTQQQQHQQSSAGQRGQQQQQQHAMKNKSSRQAANKCNKSAASAQNNNSGKTRQPQQQQPKGKANRKKGANANNCGPQQHQNQHSLQPAAPAGVQLHHNLQQQHWHREHRSLSTSSSVGSSGSSSSPSSSMLQIFSHRELQRQRHRRNQHMQQQQQQQQQQHQKTRPQQQQSQPSKPSRPSSNSSAMSSLSSGSEVKYESASEQFSSSGSPPTSQQQVGDASAIGCGCAPQVWQQQQQSDASYALGDYHYEYPRPPPRPWLHQLPQPSQNNNHSKTLQQQLQPRPSTKPSMSRKHEFTVISYNVLCDRMVNNELFPASPSIALDWLYRRELILKQLLDFDADIIALQEIELEQFEEYFRPNLGELANYEAIFEPKSRARTMDNQKRKRVDGCAIFYKNYKFTLVARHLLEFSQIAMANAQGSEAMLNRVMTKDNIGLAAVLEFIPPTAPSNTTTADNGDHYESLSSLTLTKLPNRKRNLQQQQQVPSQLGASDRSSSIGYNTHSSSQRILVCNTHIHWDPECCDVKLIQTIMLMNELECIARYYATSAGPLPSAAPHVIMKNHLDLDPRLMQVVGTTATTINGGCQSLSGDTSSMLPLVLLGDFNSMPNSGVATYLASGKINSLHKDFKSYKYTNCSNALALQQYIQHHPHHHHQQQHWSQPSGDNNNNMNTNTISNTLSVAGAGANNFRRQSSPAWCFYPTNMAQASRSSSSSSSFSSYSSSPPSSTTSSLHNHHKYEQILNYNHPFKLVSAYEKDTMPYTNYTTKFKAMIDYIFYSCDSIQLLGLLGPLDKNWLRGNRIKGLPQPHLPSDHLPLLVKLRLTSAGSDHQVEPRTMVAAAPSAQHPWTPPVDSQPYASSPLDANPILVQQQQNQTHSRYHHHHLHHPQQQQIISTLNHDYPPHGAATTRQQKQQLCKSQTVRVNSSSSNKSRIKHEQNRS